MKLLTEDIYNLWLWTYGLVAGWGIMFTIIVVTVVVLVIRQIRLERKLTYLQNRILSAERDYSLSLSKWQK
ncbi:MAG: hypothetical protein EB127_07250 [Alphaproteobacteria bacterium]|nr:hypothetical protein [Alphaproteobacteria bacterium]